MPEPTQFQCQDAAIYFELPPDVGAPRSKAKPRHPPEEPHFGRLYLRPCSTQLLPRAPDHRLGSDLANRELRIYIITDTAPNRLSISRSIFPTLVNKTPRYTNLYMRKLFSLKRKRRSLKTRFGTNSLECWIMWQELVYGTIPAKTLCLLSFKIFFLYFHFFCQLEISIKVNFTYCD